MSISEQAMEKSSRPTSFRSRIVTDEDVDRALAWLRDSAIEIGKARENAIKADRYVDHLEALLILGSKESSDAKRRADARGSEKWLDATAEAAHWAGELEKLRALREAASAKIEAWRSEQANYRGMKV